MKSFRINQKSSRDLTSDCTTDQEAVGMMTIETILTRELNIRFIDARELGCQAKLNLGIVGYAADQQTKSMLVQEAIRIFQLERSASAKDVMRKLNNDLETLKRAIPLHSSSSQMSCVKEDDTTLSDHSMSSDSTRRVLPFHFKARAA